ncbi:MAG: type 1 glutamine amidotransferase [Roseiflexaceae bacterium]
MRIRIAHLYPAQMNIYGDRGNIITLVKRCEWRGIEVTVDTIHPGTTVHWQTFDMVFFGGGQDSGQALIADDFVQRQGRELRVALADGLVTLAICGGYQLLGNYFLTHAGDKLPGIGAIDVHTIGGNRRLIGNLAVELDWQIAPHVPRTLIGFENHSGRTYVGSGAQRIGRVLAGNGNNGEDGSEGARVYNTFGCYLHGSLLPKNPHFADYLIGLALTRRYGRADLAPLDDTNELYAHQQMIQRCVR